MPTPTLTTTLPTGPVPTGQPLTFRLALDPGEGTLAAAVVRLRLPSQFFDAVTVSPLAFDGPSDSGLSTHRADGPEGLFTLAGGRRQGTAGAVDLVQVTLTPVGPAGSTLPIVLELVSGVTTAGWPLDPVTITRYLATAAEPLVVSDAQLPAARQDEAYHMVLGAVGGVAPYTWTLTDGVLPPGVTLTATGVLTGAPQALGTYSFHARATDAGTPAPAQATGAFTLTVNPAPLRIVTAALPPAAPGAGYHAPLDHSGGLPPITWSATGLPEGLSIQGAAIAGTLAASVAYGEVTVTLRAQDAADPPRQANRSLALHVVPALPIAILEVEEPVDVAVGRDLVLIPYDIDVTTTVHDPLRDPDFEREIDEARAAVLDALSDAILCSPRVVDPVGPVLGGLGEPGHDPTWGFGDEGIPGEGMPGPEGPGATPTEPPPPGLTPNPEPDNACPPYTMPGPDDGPTVVRGSAAVAALMAWYRELTGWTKGGGVPVSFFLCLDLDGDEVVCTTTGFLKSLTLTRQTLAASLSTQRASTERRTGQGTARRIRQGLRTLAPVLRPVVRPILRRQLARVLAERPPDDQGMAMAPHRPMADGDNHGIKRTDVASKPAPGTPGRPDAAVMLSLDPDGAMALHQALARRQRARTRARGGRLLATLIVTAAAVAAGIVGGGLWLAAAVGAIALFYGGAIWLTAGLLRATTDAYRAVLEDIRPIVTLPPVEPPEATITVTPGAHRATVRIRKAGGGGRSPYLAHRAAGTTLGYTVTFKPKSSWPRFDGVTTLSGSGRSGATDYAISLYGSDLDVLVAAADGTLKVVAAKGDGTFDTPRTVGQVAGTGTLQALARPLDAIGRSSMVAVRGRALRVLFNDGIHGFDARSLTLHEPHSDAALSLDAHGLGDDGWMALLLGFQDELALITDLQGYYAGDSPRPTVQLVTVPGEVARDPLTVAGFADLQGTVGISPALIAAGRVSGQGWVLPITGDSFDAPAPLAGLADVDPTRQPVALAIGHFGQPEAQLAIGLRQAKQVLWWQATAPPVLTGAASLAIRPASLAEGPTVAPGLIVSAHEVSALLWVHWEGDPPAIEVQLLRAGQSPWRIDAAAGMLAAIDQMAGKLLVYR